MICLEHKNKLEDGTLRVSLDSRLVQPGDYFVMVRGEKSDGHGFIEDAISQGAAGILEEGELYQLAQEKLNRARPTVIAVTGSVGKTTMCSFVSTVLSTKYKTARGTLNTKLGLATNIINDMQLGDEFFIAEVGMDRMGEIRETGKFIKPSVAVITNISESHLEKLGSLENIKQAKSEVLLTLSKQGVAFLNWENKHIQSIAHLAPNVITYGLDHGDYQKDNLPQHMLVFGRHNQLNVVGALAIGRYFGLADEEIAQVATRLTNPKGRLNKLEGINKSVVFDDTYNASPTSTINALESITNYCKKTSLQGRKIAVFGGMLELGDFEDEGHHQVGQKLAEYGFDVLILVGELARKIESGIPKKSISLSKPQIYHVSTPEEAGQCIREVVKPAANDIILAKASQGLRLERTVELLLKNSSRDSKLLVRQDARWK